MRTKTITRKIKRTWRERLRSRPFVAYRIEKTVVKAAPIDLRSGRWERVKQ